MQRNIFLTAATLILFGLMSTASMAQPFGPPEAPEPPGPMMQGEKKAFAGLELTDEQKNKIAELRLATQKEIAPLKAKIVQLRTDLKLQLTAETPNLGKIESINKEIGAVQAQIQYAQNKQHVEVRKLLTPEQRKKFDTFLLSGGKFRMAKMAAARKHAGRRMMMRRHRAPRKQDF